MYLPHLDVLVDRCVHQLLIGLAVDTVAQHDDDCALVPCFTTKRLQDWYHKTDPSCTPMPSHVLTSPLLTVQFNMLYVNTGSLGRDGTGQSCDTSLADFLQRVRIARNAERCTS